MTTQRGGEGTQVGAGGDDLPWWFKYLGRGFGILGGVLAILFGALNCISVTPKCIAAGLVLMVAGVIALTLEAPCCFVFFDFGDKLTRWSESRKPWHKVVLFVGKWLIGGISVQLRGAPNELFQQVASN